MSFDIPGLIEGPMSDEDAAVMDAVVEQAMSNRSQRWENLRHEESGSDLSEVISFRC
jgi:hypothetical protein